MQLLVVMIFYSVESKLFLNDLKHQVHSSFLLTATILILLLADNVSTSFSAPKIFLLVFLFPANWIITDLYNEVFVLVIRFSTAAASASLLGPKVLSRQKEKIIRSIFCFRKKNFTLRVSPFSEIFWIEQFNQIWSRSFGLEPWSNQIEAQWAHQVL